jgi:hypothetical protein
LKEEAVDRVKWRNRFGRSCGPVVWQITDEWMNEWWFVESQYVQGGSNMKGLFVCKQVTVCPGHIWTTLYHLMKNISFFFLLW